MKKIFIIMIALATLGISPKIVAQELTPEKGDWAIGTDIIPLLNSLGRVFWNNPGPVGFGGNSTWFNNNGAGLYIRPDVSILGKYMLTDKIGLRANIGLNFMNTTLKTNAPDFAARQLDPNSVAEITNKAHAKQNGFNVALGGEYRIGKKRVQGVFGADLILGYYSLITSYTYGNALSDLYRVGNAADMIGGVLHNTAIIGGVDATQQMRILQQNTNNIFQIGANVSAGIEVFVAPKIALGGQVNLSYVANIGGKIHTTGEYFDVAATRTAQKWTNINGAIGNAQQFSTNNIGGALYMMFYFGGK